MEEINKNKVDELTKLLFGTYCKLPENSDERTWTVEFPTNSGIRKEVKIRKDEGIIEYMELRIQQLEEQVRILSTNK